MTLEPQLGLGSYVVIASAGIIAGWVINRLRAGAQEPADFVPVPRLVDGVAVILSSLFATRVLGPNPTIEDHRRAFKNALAAIAAMLAILLIVLVAGIGNWLVALALVGVAIIELGEALVIYGAADEPLLNTETNTQHHDTRPR